MNPAALILDFDMLDSASRGSASLSVQHGSDLGIGDAWESALVPSGGSTVHDMVFDITAGSPTGVGVEPSNFVVLVNFRAFLVPSSH